MTSYPLETWLNRTNCVITDSEDDEVIVKKKWDSDDTFSCKNEKDISDQSPCSFIVKLTSTPVEEGMMFIGVDVQTTKRRSSFRHYVDVPSS